MKGKNGTYVLGKAILNNGSQSNFISEKFLSKLGLKYSQSQITINKQVSRALKIVNLEMSLRFL